MGHKNLLGGDGLVWLIVVVIVIAVVIVLILGRRSDNEHPDGSPQDIRDERTEKWWLIGLAIAAVAVFVLWYSGILGGRGGHSVVKVEKVATPREGKSASLRSAQSARGPRSQSPLSARSPARGSLRTLSPESGNQ